MKKSNIDFQLEHKEIVDKARDLVKKAIHVHKTGN